MLRGRGVEDGSMYAPYGAVFFFSRGLMERVKLPRNVPLFAEEPAVGQMVELAGGVVVYDEDLHFHHFPNTTTGLLSLFARAELLGRAYGYIARNYA